MAVAHLHFNDGTKYGSALRVCLAKLEQGKEGLRDIIGDIALMIDGDGGDPAHFAYATDKFGFASNVVAKAAWEELNSLFFKLSTNNSVSNVDAAMLQAFRKFS